MDNNISATFQKNNLKNSNTNTALTKNYNIPNLYDEYDGKKKKTKQFATTPQICHPIRCVEI